MLYMITKTLRGGDARLVYRRFREQGRLAAEDLEDISSWVTDDLRRCFQVMRCDDAALLEQWMSQWKDLVDFEVMAVMTSEAATVAIA